MPIMHLEMVADFVLCIGDDRSDEDMFEAITRAIAAPRLSPVAEVSLAQLVGNRAKLYTFSRTQRRS
uniref:Putative trehalose-phosphatase, HAD-like domain protein n=1 Tax=Helianthus annuus TaxID=4232 RepID=A0A251RLR2_HELAN